MVTVQGAQLRPHSSVRGLGMGFGCFFPLAWGVPGKEVMVVGWEPQALRPLLVCPAVPPVLYPNLAELENYMGLALSSKELQKNLIPEGSTVGVGAGGSPTLCGSPCHSISGRRVPLGPHPAQERDQHPPRADVPHAPTGLADRHLPCRS